MCLVECIASAASGTLKHNNQDIKQFINATTDGVLGESEPNACQIDRADLLDVLRFVLECSKQHFNPKYRCQGTKSLLSYFMNGNYLNNTNLVLLLYSL